MDDLEFRIAKLELGSGDALVINCPAPVDCATLERLHAYVRKQLPGCPLLVISGGLELSILTRAEIEQAIVGEYIAAEPADRGFGTKGSS